MAQKKAAKKTAKKPGGSPAKASQALVSLRDHAEAAKDPKVAASALNAITEIQTSWTKHQEAKAKQKKTGFECKEKLEADEAALKAAIEEPIESSASSAEKTKASLAKLELVERRWQEFEETKEANAERRKAAKERVTETLDKLQRALAASSQLTLPHT